VKNLLWQVLELHPDVDAIIEAIVWDNARPEDPWSDPAIRWTSQDMHQVDVTPMENALDDLCQTLRLNTSYTLFLMNPKLPYPDFNYGYRFGLSNAELDRLHENVTLVEQLHRRPPVRPHFVMSDDLVQDAHVLAGQVRSFRGAGEDEKRRKMAEQREKLKKLVREKSAEPGAPQHHGVHENAAQRGEKPGPRGRPKYMDMRDLSQSWAALYKQGLHDLSYWQRHPAEETDDVDEDDAEQAYLKDLRTVLGRPRDQALPADMLFEVAVTRLLQAPAGSGDKEYIRAAIEDKHMREDCLVDNWVGRGRFAFLDFSAGPFEWGPIVGGKGVRSYRTVPDIVSLQTAATDFTAGGAWKDPAYVNRMHSQLKEHGVEKLQQEKKMLLAFIGRHCASHPGAENPHDGSSDAEATCAEMRHKLSAVEAFVRAHTRIEDEDEALLNQLSFVTGGPHEGANISLVQHSMFARLSSIIETTQRQLFTPSAAAAPAPYKSQVFFHVYIVTNQGTYNPEGASAFDYAKFKAELEQFRLPRQGYHFVLHHYTMAEDQALAAAYANALRSAVVATLKVDGRFVATKRMYLDSRVLQRHLQTLHKHLMGASDLTEAKTPNKKDVPVFIFSMDFPLPVFVDKHYQARSLEDMVIAVQSDEVEWDSHLACNGARSQPPACLRVRTRPNAARERALTVTRVWLGGVGKPVVWNLRNPTRAVLASTVQHLAGVLPMHLNFDQAHSKVSQDWLWSVGCSPLAATSGHVANFSAVHIDTAHRHWVVSTLHEALELLNEGVATLATTTTSLDNRHASGAVPSDRLVQMHVAVRLSWGKALHEVHRLNYQDAIPHVHTALRNARHFRDLAQHSQQLLLLSGCIHPVHNQPFDWGMVLMVAASVACVALYYLVVPDRVKPKLN